MEISRTNMLQYLSDVYGTMLDTTSSSLLEVGQGNQSGGASESLDISTLGKLRNAVSQMSDEDKKEMRAFHDQMMESVMNGTFDASQMAANAPEALKSFAEENGIDLESMLEDEATKMKNFAEGKGPIPPPPAMMYGSDGSGKSFSAQELSMDFLRQLLQGEDGEETLLSSINNQ